MSTALALLERAVMDRLLAGDDPTLQILAEQFRAAEVTDREVTGAGFFVTFLVPAQAPRVEGRRSFSFGDVTAEIEGLHHGAGFVLHVRDGAIDYLEGYSYDEPWPVSIGRFRLSYVKGGERDLGTLRKTQT